MSLFSLTLGNPNLTLVSFGHVRMRMYVSSVSSFVALTQSQRVLVNFLRLKPPYGLLPTLTTSVSFISQTTETPLSFQGQPPAEQTSTAIHSNMG